MSYLPCLRFKKPLSFPHFFLSLSVLNSANWAKAVVSDDVGCFTFQGHTKSYDFKVSPRKSFTLSGSEFWKAVCYQADFL